MRQCSRPFTTAGDVESVGRSGYCGSQSFWCCNTRRRVFGGPESLLSVCQLYEILLYLAGSARVEYSLYIRILCIFELISQLQCWCKLGQLISSVDLTMYVKPSEWQIWPESLLLSNWPLSLFVQRYFESPAIQWASPVSTETRALRFPRAFRKFSDNSFQPLS